MLQVFADGPPGRQYFLDFGRGDFFLGLCQNLDDLGNAKGTDKDRDNLYAAFQLHEPHRIPGEYLQRIPTYHGQEQTEETGDPSFLHRIGTGNTATDQDAEESQEEELERSELHCKPGNERGKQYDEHHTDHGTYCRGGGSQAESLACPSLFGEGVPFQGSCSGGCSTGDIDHDRGEGTSIDSTYVDGHQGNHCRFK